MSKKYITLSESDQVTLQGMMGKVAKENYAYQKNGSCALLASIEPLTGKRLA